MLMDQYGDDAAEEISILYGGSVKPDNVMELLKNKAVIAGLVLTAGLIYLIATGNMGGSRDATNNYGKVMRGG